MVGAGVGAAADGDTGGVGGTGFKVGGAGATGLRIGPSAWEPRTVKTVEGLVAKTSLDEDEEEFEIVMCGIQGEVTDMVSESLWERKKKRDFEVFWILFSGLCVYSESEDLMIVCG